MKARLQEKNRVIELRKRGLSYNEIIKDVPISKSLVSRWLKNIFLTMEEKMNLAKRIIERREKGRQASIFGNRKRRLDREIAVFEDAKKLFDEYKNDHPFIIGVILYWATGSKVGGNFQFITADPEKAIFMNKWLQKYLKTSKETIKYRIFAEDKTDDSIVNYWAGMLGIDRISVKKTIYNAKKRSGKGQNRNYRGSIGIIVTSIYAVRLIGAWQKLVIQYHGQMRP